MNWDDASAITGNAVDDRALAPARFRVFFDGVRGFSAAPNTSLGGCLSFPPAKKLTCEDLSEAPDSLLVPAPYLVLASRT